MIDVPVNIINAAKPRILDLIRNSERRIGVDLDDAFYGDIFLYYLALSDPKIVMEIGLSHLSEFDIYYNRFYFFTLFSKLYQIKHGYDAGIEQQAFQLLEESPSGVNLAIVEYITARVDKEVTTM